MKILSLIFFLFCSHFCFLQIETNRYLSIYQSVSTLAYSSSNIEVGIGVKANNGTIYPFLHYHFGGNLEREFNSYYAMKYHVLGGGVKYRFKTMSKIYSPTVQFSLSTEIATPYRGKYLKTSYREYYMFAPTNKYATEKLSIGGDPYIAFSHFTYYYVSTPLLGNFLLGHEFRLARGLYCNFGLGYSFRAVKVRYKEWRIYEEEPLPDISNAYSLRNLKLLHIVDCYVGFNYNFSLNKKH